MGQGDLNLSSAFPLTGVLYVKGLKANLININQLCDTNYDVQFTKSQCLVSSDGNSVLTEVCNVVTINDDESLSPTLQMIPSVTNPQEAPQLSSANSFGEQSVSSDCVVSPYIDVADTAEPSSVSTDGQDTNRSFDYSSHAR
uniref:Uncharacterized protein n=1 Tax=Cannabis sativa TaxID=3483 RepID=A0A803QGY2_CANSA